MHGSRRSSARIRIGYCTLCGKEVVLACAKPHLIKFHPEVDSEKVDLLIKLGLEDLDGKSNNHPETMPKAIQKLVKQGETMKERDIKAENFMRLSSDDDSSASLEIIGDKRKLQPLHQKRHYKRKFAVDDEELDILVFDDSSKQSNHGVGSVDEEEDLNIQIANLEASSSQRKLKRLSHGKAPTPKKTILDEIIEGKTSGPLDTFFRPLGSRRAEKEVHNLLKNESASDEESEEGSLKDFIVDDESSEGEIPEREESEEEEEANEPPKKFEFQFQGDLQSALAKNDVLCMRAIAALYRQQTDDEIASQTVRRVNKRGFDKSEASRASRLADKILRGDHLSRVKLEPRQLTEGEIIFCRKVALKHAAQLFSIIQQNEDPFFPNG